MKKIKNYLMQDVKIYQKLIVSVALLVIVPLILMSLLFMGRLNNIVEGEIVSSYSYAVDQYVQNVSNKLSTYQNIIESIAMNKTILGIFTEQNNYQRNDIYTIGKQVSDQVASLSFNNNRGAIYKITLYSLNENFPSDGNNISNISFIKDQKWYTSNNVLKQSSCFFGKTYSGLNIISLTQPIVQSNAYNFLNPLGFIKMDIDINSIFNFSNARINQEFSGFYIIDNNEKIIYSLHPTGPRLSDSVIGSIAGNLSGQLQYEENREREIAIYQRLQPYGYYGVFVYPYSEINRQVRESGTFIEIYFAILLLVFMGLTIAFSKAFSNRISLLVRKMDNTAKGSLDALPVIGGKDEIGILDDRFNTMVDRIKALIQENYIRQLEKKEAELDALQFQINPHFLYNTLQVIDTYAEKYTCREISDISMCLGEMFRYNMSFGGNEFVRLSDEINHIRNYLYIQNIRFGDKFIVFFDIPDELNDCKILRFILQPLVENSIVHGFQEKRGQGCLEIRCRMDGDRLLIILQDDGAGMDQDRLESLTGYINDRIRSIPSAFTRSVGIKNVNSRLKLAYGDEYGITIKSSPDRGTIVTVMMPDEKFEEKPYVQSSCG